MFNTKYKGKYTDNRTRTELKPFKFICDRFYFNESIFIYLKSGTNAFHVAKIASKY